MNFSGRHTSEADSSSSATVTIFIVFSIQSKDILLRFRYVTAPVTGLTLPLGKIFVRTASNNSGSEQICSEADSYRRRQSCGYEVLVADNGAEAYTRFEADRPDLIISDLAMREMTCPRFSARREANLSDPDQRA